MPSQRVSTTSRRLSNALAALQLQQPDLSKASAAAAAAAAAATAGADYARAEKALAQTVNPLCKGGSVQPHWLTDGTFWYSTADSEVVLVNPQAKSKTVLGAAEMAALGIPASGAAPPPPMMMRMMGSSTVGEDGVPLTVSPDGNSGAFVRDWNLWVRDMGTGAVDQHAACSVVRPFWRVSFTCPARDDRQACS